MKQDRERDDAEAVGAADVTAFAAACAVELREIGTAMRRASDIAKDRFNEIQYAATRCRTEQDVRALLGQYMPLLCYAPSWRDNLLSRARRGARIREEDIAVVCGTSVLPKAGRIVRELRDGTLGEQVTALRMLRISPGREPGESWQAGLGMADAWQETQWWDDEVVALLVRIAPDKMKVNGAAAWGVCERRVNACEMLADLVVAVPKLKPRLTRGQLAEAMLGLSKGKKVKDIASEVGCAASTLYRNKEFRKARQQCDYHRPRSDP